VNNTNCKECLELRIEFVDWCKPFVFCSEECNNEVFPDEPMEEAIGDGPE